MLPPGQGLLQPCQAPLTQMDRWILSRLSAAVEATNTGFSEYNFPQVILWSDWLTKYNTNLWLADWFTLSRPPLLCTTSGCMICVTCIWSIWSQCSVVRTLEQWSLPGLSSTLVWTQVSDSSLPSCPTCPRNCSRDCPGGQTRSLPPSQSHPSLLHWTLLTGENNIFSDTIQVFKV